MYQNFKIIETLKNNEFNKIHIEEILNYLETLDFDLKYTRYIGQIMSKNERLAKYFFWRDRLKIGVDNTDKSFHIHEVLDQCIDWSEFWRLLVIKKGFCCIRLSGELNKRKRYVFLCGPNILSGPYADEADSILEDGYD
tara:strand:- start:1392 stop:1808 length:417 start_codon:yes stop_codon:yes gene_type:complete